MAELLDNGILLYSSDIQARMTYPTYAQMRDNIAHLVQVAQKYGVVDCKNTDGLRIIQRLNDMS